MKLSDADLERVRSAAQALLAEHQLPGLAVGIVCGDDLVLAEGFGWAEIESRRPMRPDLRQRIGSITKTMTALCAMALVDEGKLSLDDRVVDLVPDLVFHGAAEGMRLHHLLTHTSGIGEAPLLEDLKRLDTLFGDAHSNDSRLVDALPRGLTIEVSPGTKWAYANFGFAVLGEIVMRAESAPLTEVMQRRIFAPLGMTDSDLRDEPHPGLSAGYHRALPPDERARREAAGIPVADETPVDGLNIRGRYRYLPGLARRAAGAVQSTIPDMARYASALLAKSRGIVRAETFDAMVAPRWCPDERFASMGYAFMRRPSLGRRSFGHGGGVEGGWQTSMDVFPDDGVAVLTHANLMYDHRFQTIPGRLAQAVFDAPEPALPRPARIPVELLAAASGVYEAPGPGPLTNFRVSTATGRIQIRASGDELLLHARRGPWQAGARMLPADASDPLFFALEREGMHAGNVALLRGADGRVTGLRLELMVELVRNDAIEPWVR